MCLHVDDIYWAGDASLEKGVVQALRDMFPIGKESDWEFEYLGLLVKAEMDATKKMTISVSQRQYVATVKPIDVGGTKQQDQRLAHKQQHDEYMELVGKLLWLTGQTRADIAFLVMRLAQKSSKPTVADLHQANAVLKRAKRDDIYLKYVHVPLSDLWLLAYSDAAWAKLENGKTGVGCIVGLAGETQYNVLSWRCRGLKRVVRSTMAGETMALGDLLDEVENIQHTLKQLLGDILLAVARTDLKSVYDHVHWGRQLHEKRLLVELQALREAQKEKRMEIEWCTSEQQLADALTKSMVAWRLVNVLESADINAMHKTLKKPATPWTHRRHTFPVSLNEPMVKGSTSVNRVLKRA